MSDFDSAEFTGEDIDITVEDILGENLDEKPKVKKTEKEVVAERVVESVMEVVAERIEQPESTGALNSTTDSLDLAGRLATWNASCRDLFLDLRTINFVATEEEMYIECQDKNYYDKLIYFKTDNENPKDPKIVHAQKQFCKFLGVPHSFFFNNRPQLKMDIVKTWRDGLDANESKARCIARLRETQARDYAVLRAFVPENFSLMANQELIEIINQSVSVPSKLEFAVGDGRDDLILHARYLFGDKFKICDKEFCLGFSVVASDLDASPLIVEAFLYQLESKTAYIASYGLEPFFRSKYEGIQPKDVKELFPKLIERISSEAGDICARVQAANIEIKPEDLCSEINTWKGLSTNFKRALLHEMSSCREDMCYTLDFARHMSMVAKDYDSTKRLNIERASGRILNLCFGKE